MLVVDICSVTAVFNGLHSHTKEFEDLIEQNVQYMKDRTKIQLSFYLSSLSLYR